jgi:hypothetical protein
MIDHLKPILLAASLVAGLGQASAETLLIEAEQFSRKGGWSVDTQFIETMGSPYLIAHGLGEAVADASTEVEITDAGSYKVWVRTLDWSESLGRQGGAGRFTLSIDGKQLGGELGKGAATWHWEEVGTVDLAKGKSSLALKDLSGFDGRVDAVLLSRKAGMNPPEKCLLKDRMAWKIPGAPEGIQDAGDFDLVVIGGGYGGLGAAISAARMGSKVALIQNREVLGGNGLTMRRLVELGESHRMTLLSI